jgi:hypothetical protein
MKTRIVALVIGTLAACGGDDGDGAAFVGVYQVTAHTMAETPGSQVACTATGPAVVGPRYVKLAVDDFFDDPSFIRLSECDDAAGATCSETLTLFNPGGPGLIEESANSQIGGGFPCQLYYSKATAALTGAALHIEILDKYDGTDRPASACTLEAAEGLASSTQCQRAERYDATRVP